MIALCLSTISVVVGLLVWDYSQPPTPGVTNTEVRIGNSLALEGPLAYLGRDYLKGLRLAIEEANKAGGINDRKIVLVSRDDGYEPLRCVLNTRDLIANEKVFALANYVGTPTCIKAQPIWTGAHTPVVGFFTGAEALREPFNRYNFHIRASYTQEANAIVDTLVHDRKLQRIAIIYQYDSFGQSVSKEVKKALERYQLTIVAEGSYERNTVDVDSALQTILAAHPEAVFLIGTYTPLSKFVKEAKAHSKQPLVFASCSFIGEEAFLDTLGKDAEGCLVSQVIPLYDDPHHIRLVDDFIRNLHKMLPDSKPSFTSLEGYINGRVLVEGLKRAGRRLTHESFISGLESIKDEPFGPGFEISFGPKDHQGSSTVYMTQIKGGRFEYLDSKN